MPRTAPYCFTIARPDDAPILEDRLTYDLEIVPADTIDLFTATRVPVTYAAREGRSMPGSQGYPDGKPVGMPLAATRTVTFALSEMPSDLAAYLVRPRVAGATLTIGGYSRTVELPNLMVIYSDRNQTPGTRTTVEGIYVQRPILTHGGRAILGGVVTLETEWVDAAKWVMETMTAADVEAYCFLHKTPSGPHRWIFQDIWTEAGRLYTVRHGDRSDVGVYRQYTLHRLADVFDSVGGVASLLFRLITRRGGLTTSTVRLVSRNTDGTETDANNTRTHWTTYSVDHAGDWDKGAVVDAWDRWVCTRVALNTTPTVAFHGFLHAPPPNTEGIPEDTLAAWQTPWDWLVDECKAAGVVVHPVGLKADGGEWQVGYRFAALLSPHYDTTADVFTPIDLGPEDTVSDGIDYEISVGAISRAIAPMPAGNADAAEPVEIRSGWGAESDDDFEVPRGFHNLPIAWAEGNRRYEVANPIGGGSGGYENINLITQAFNALTLYYIGDADGLLSAPAPIRLHHAAVLQVTDAADESVDYAHSLPTPIGADYADDAELGDTEMGTPYLVAVAHAQRSAGMPRATAQAMVTHFGSPQGTTYTADFPTAIMAGQLGNQLDTISGTSKWNSGNALLPSGATYFGELPGDPFIVGIEDDLLGDQVATTKLLGQHTP